MAYRERLVLEVRRHPRQNGTDGQDSNEDWDAIAGATLKRCALNDKGLRALDIADTRFSSRFFSLLGDTMQHNTVMQELYLDSCNIDDEAVRMLSKGIGQNTSRSLRVLSLEDNQIHCKGVGYLAKLMAGCSRWARTFGSYRTHASGPGNGLRYLSLKGNRIASVGCKAIAEALMSSDDSLERLSLESNRVDDWGAGWFAQALKNHNVLQLLDLHRNPIGDDGVEELKCACEFASASLVVLRGTGADARQMKEAREEDPESPPELQTESV
jgi:Ran GTPase-activating protein (RanGAP) involved in mRNA processing and transport